MGIFDFLKEFIHTTTAPHSNLNSGSLQTLLFWKKKKKKRVHQTAMDHINVAKQNFIYQQGGGSVMENQ